MVARQSRHELMRQSCCRGHIALSSSMRLSNDAYASNCRACQSSNLQTWLCWSTLYNSRQAGPQVALRVTAVCRVRPHCHSCQRSVLLKQALSLLLTNAIEVLALCNIIDLASHCQQQGHEGIPAIILAQRLQA